MVLDAFSAEALLEERSAAQAALRLAARGVVNDARARDALRGERLIIALREWWNARRPLRRFDDELLRDALWSKLVGISIREFYSRGGGE
jgi:hypothetical protein